MKILSMSNFLFSNGTDILHCALLYTLPMFLLIVPSPVKLQNSLYNHWHPFVTYKVGTLLITD
jgi:hypothetical protein